MTLRTSENCLLLCRLRHFLFTVRLKYGSIGNDLAPSTRAIFRGSIPIGQWDYFF